MTIYLDPDEVERMVNAATNLRDKLLVKLLFRLRCSMSEVLSLTPGDVDLEQGIITFNHLKTRLKVSCPHCKRRLAKKHSFCPECGRKVVGVIRKALEQRRVKTLTLDSDTLQTLREFIQLGGPVECNGRVVIFSIHRQHVGHIVRYCAWRAGLAQL